MRSAIAAQRRPEAARELFEALHRHDERAVRRLVSDDPELAGIRTPDGETPLHIAAETDQPALVEALLAAGADPTATLAWRGDHGRDQYEQLHRCPVADERGGEAAERLRDDDHVRPVADRLSHGVGVLG